MQGTLALVGSGEYLPSMAPVDRELLARVPGEPHVVCLPTAAGTEGDRRIRYWTDLGVAHFRDLGAHVEAVNVIDRQSADDPACAERIRASNFVYLSGGKPAYLYDTLAGSRAWAAILAVLERGGVLAGCSAGAMVCGDSAIFWGRHPGFRLLPGAVILPHYDELPSRLARFVKLWLGRRATVVGIDGDTALLVTNGTTGESRRLEVLGRQGVTIWWKTGPVKYAAGQQLSWEEGRRRSEAP